MKALFLAMKYVLAEILSELEGEVMELTARGFHFGRLMRGVFRYEYAGTIFLNNKMLYFVVSTDNRKDGGCRKGWFYSSEKIDGSHLIPFNDQRNKKGIIFFGELVVSFLSPNSLDNL